MGEGPINQLVTLDNFAYYNLSLSHISSNRDSILATPTDNPTSSSSHTMALHPEINDTDEEDETHINVITSLTTGSQSDRCVLDSGPNRHIFGPDTCHKTVCYRSSIGIYMPISKG